MVVKPKVDAVNQIKVGSPRNGRANPPHPTMLGRDGGGISFASRTVAGQRGRFNKALLPPAESFYRRAGLKLIGRGEWRDALCPFHSDKHPSLRVNRMSGAYRCFVCGARGGDVLDFHRRRTGLGFVEAAKALNAWE